MIIFLLFATLMFIPFIFEIINKFYASIITAVALLTSALVALHLVMS